MLRVVESVDLGLLFPHLAGVLVDRVERVGGRIVFEVRSRAVGGRCPSCAVVSRRVHGRYSRMLTDVPVAGQGVVIRVRIRRFKCLSGGCAAVTFAEQIPMLTVPHARYTPAFEGWITRIGLALAGRAGARLSGALAAGVGRDTLLRRVRALPDPAVGRVGVLGVDDFAFKRGHTYGTILIDMSTHRPVDVLDTRESEALAAWLRAHPGVEVICRDRATRYAEGASVGAPEAIQVADRFHLWHNLCEAAGKVVITQQSRLAAPEATPAPAPAPATPASAEAPPVVDLPELKVVTRLRADYERVNRLLSEGMSRNAVSRETGLHIATVRKFADAGCVEDVLAKTFQRAKVIDPYHEHLHRRWNEGVTNAAQLTREIAALGYPGGELAVQRYLRRFRDGRAAPAPGPKPPTVREATRWLLTNPDHRHPDDARKLGEILGRSPELERLAAHVGSFARMMTALEGYRLEEWIAAVEADTLPALTSFATTLRRDLDAVRHGLTLPYSSGAVEGNVNRIKMLKRQMYGRARFDLLRKRILLA
jgi:transposase